MMSTQIRFDLAGLRRAIESNDSGYLLALYADNAEVHVIDSDDPSRSRILQGKRAIASWIQDLCSQEIDRRVVNSIAGESRVALAEEIHASDGRNIWYTYTAEVSRGQITRETITSTVRRAEVDNSGSWTAADDDARRAEPTRAPDRATSPNLPSGGRYLAGNFLG
jgi:hypothetical protein